MTDEIARRRRDGIDLDDVLGRLLTMQDDGGSPLDAETARRILVGLLVAAIRGSSVHSSLVVTFRRPQP